MTLPAALIMVSSWLAGTDVSGQSGERDLLRQQEILAEFGELALRSESLDQILTEACRLVGEALETDLAKVMELQAGGETLLVRAGVGWKSDVIGQVIVEASPGSSEGFALSTGHPAISDDIATETRFEYADFIKNNGVRAIVSVIILGAENKPPFGILQVDSKVPRHFSERDTRFLRGYANLIAAAVDRLRVAGETHVTQATLVSREAELYALNETLEERVALRTAALAAEQASRQEAQEELRQLNRDLDIRVNERTARLRESNERLQLLDQITQAIGQRQDVESILQVVVLTLQDRLPADFVCVCRYDRVRKLLTVSHIGSKSNFSSNQLEVAEGASIAVDHSDLSRCVAGEVVYQPDISDVDFPFATLLSRKGLRSMVLAPLMNEGTVFGILVVARRKSDDLLGVDCEFLRQVGEHVGLAAHQSQLHDSLQQAYDDLKQSQQMVVERERLRAIGQMASGIAHDINNAISPVSIYNHLLLEDEAELAPKVRDHLQLVGRVIKDISATVGRLREFYRPEDAAAELELVDLNALVPQVVELTRARWSDMPQQRGAVIKVSTALETDLPPIMGNPSELREAMTNLIFNAVDALPEGGTITIRTEALRPAVGAKPMVRLEIGDTGVGMDAETRTRCLEAFFTTKGERGTGLGLAMVQHAAQRHKARLDIITTPGAGTRIQLDFFAAAEGSAGKASAPPRAETRPLRLLLIDDDPAVLSATATILGLYGHAITVADGGQAGIDALRSALKAGECFDVIVTDLGMPYVGGNQVALAAKEIFPDTPVVLLTGWGQRMATGDQNPAHVDYVLSKPADLDELREVFAQLTNPKLESGKRA
ncbi:GAF domain-containing protein [Sphingomonas sp. RB3P16]|uniref:GAF domain-containing protein n=1 Tax=Parasphingomonas frigoris TaxID=3096163 RepID=UPI002FC78E3A